MSASIAAWKLLACIAMMVVGGICLIHSIRAKEFYHSHLSGMPNQRLAAWFARPLFFVMGIFWIYAAVAYFRVLWHMR